MTFWTGRKICSNCRAGNKYH